MTRERGRAGLYIHIPFCLTRCGYCAFNTYAGLERLAGRYVSGLCRESDIAAPSWRGVRFGSLFFGGGTPTTLPARQLADLLADLGSAFEFETGAEVTAEANPDTVDERYLSEIRGAGVNRLSIGVQSFDPDVLQALERIHSARSARVAYRAARTAGFDNVNLDLIYGANGESLPSWRATLIEAIELKPEHLSCYALTIEPATPLGRKVAVGLVPAPDPDLQAEMYQMACELLSSAGYEHYEVSNWARDGRRSIHNAGYWKGRPYLGLGAGAHSYRGGERWWNVRPPQSYLEAVEAGRLPVGGFERMTPQERELERLLLGLRVAEGVPAEWVDAARMDTFVAEGLAVRRGDRLALTDRGMLLANDLILELAG